MIPTKEECFDLFERYEMLAHVKLHCSRVAEVAMFIAKRLNNNGHQALDLRLVLAGGLLHDITKTICIKTKENHAITGGALVTELGYPVVGDIVRQHILLDPGVIDNNFVSEAEVINYSDKRVKHTEIVLLEERFRDVAIRYGAIRDDFSEIFWRYQDEARRIENKIFCQMDISPDSLKDLVEHKNSK